MVAVHQHSPHLKIHEQVQRVDDACTDNMIQIRLVSQHTHKRRGYASAEVAEWQHRGSV